MNDYPQSAVNAAKKALKFKEENPKMSCGTLVGWNRANQIAKRENLSKKTIKRTYSFLSRAKVYDTGSFKNEEGKYVCGSIMYAAWGGNSMLSWCKKKIEEMTNIIKIKGGVGDLYNDSEYLDYQLSQLDDSKDLEIHLDSLGGSFTDAISMYHSLAEYKGKTKAIYKGLCASATTVIASACDEVVMTDASAILIHKVLGKVDILGFFNGDDIDTLIKDLKAQKKNLNTLSEVAANIYSIKTGGKINEMLAQMKSDTWILPEDALKMGLIDYIVPTKKDKKGKDLIEELQNKIQGVEMLNGVTLPSFNKENSTKNDMDIKATIAKLFGKNETLTLKREDVELLANSIKDTLQNEVSELQSKVETLEAKTQEVKTENNQEIVNDLTDRLTKIESRDKDIATILNGFVEGLNKSFDKKLEAQNAKLTETIKQLQLKENTIVTGDRSFEGATPTTEDWINQLKKLTKK